MKLAGDQNSPLRIRDDASADEIRAEIMKRLAVLTSAGLIDLQALPAPDGETVRQVRNPHRSNQVCRWCLAVDILQDWN
jgi:hypothetical protein